MSGKFQSLENGTRPSSNHWNFSVCLVALFALSGFVRARADALDDRAAVERVYHEHRIGTKLPFEEAVPRDVIARMVGMDRKKETVLKRVYSVVVTAGQVAAEVRRIDETTRAPAMLAELKQALGNDANRFAEAVARPIVVDRILRERFADDAMLHAGPRERAERLRSELLPLSAVERSERMRAIAPDCAQSVSWLLVSPPDAAPSAPVPLFSDLSEELQRVLRVQLRGPGDVSAVIESTDAFLLFVRESSAPDRFDVTVATFAKRGFEDWLAAQAE